MEHEVIDRLPLLNKKGRIIEEGWARKPNWVYDRSKVKGGAIRIKEWDYYAIVNQAKEYAVTMTISDLGYAALFAIAYIDFKNKDCAQIDAMKFFTFGKVGLSANSTDDHQVSWANKKIRVAAIKKDEGRHLMFACPSLQLPDGSVGLDVDVILNQDPYLETTNIATSWKEQRKAFYLNEKVNCMPAVGTIRRGMEEETLLLGEAWGVLDWGRGRWTYQNTWYWASASGLLENVSFGFNLGYGFSDRSPASENTIIYNGKVHKLGPVSFSFKEGEYLEHWKISDAQERLSLTFHPAVDRASKTNFVVIKSNQHQVFGYFHGTCKLDDGTTLTLQGFPGFAEEVLNRW